MKLTAYKYDKRTCAYAGAEDVWPHVSHDRLMYELPPWATPVKPPDVEKGQAPVWIDQTQRWVVVSDHRGERGWCNWKGEEVTILRLGDPSHWHLTRKTTDETV
jgi:hypothetical protein